MKKFFLMLLFICLFFTGCKKISNDQLTETLFDTITINNSNIVSDKENYTFLTDEKASAYIEDNNISFVKYDDYKTIIVLTDNPIYRIEVSTQENGEFVYRNVFYKIPISAGDGWFLYQIPGACSEYKIFLYQVN